MEDSPTIRVAICADYKVLSHWTAATDGLPIKYFNYTGYRSWLASYPKPDLMHAVCFTPSELVIALHGAKRFQIPVVREWVGSDVYNLKTRMLARVSNRLLNTFVNLNIAVSDRLGAEILNLINTPPVTFHRVIRSPERATPIPPPPPLRVLAYTGGRKSWAFYGGDVLEQIAVELRDLVFTVIGERPDDAQAQPPNVKYVPFDSDVSKYYSEAHVLLRLPLHDGLPRMVLEAMSYGMQVITNTPVPFTRYAADYRSAIHTLTDLVEHWTPNMPGANYVRTLHNHETAREEVVRIYNKVLPASKQLPERLKVGASSS